VCVCAAAAAMVIIIIISQEMLAFVCGINNHNSLCWKFVKVSCAVPIVMLRLQKQQHLHTIRKLINNHLHIWSGN